METSTSSDSAVVPARAASVWRKRLVWGVGGLLALCAVSWLAVPPLVKSQAEKLASEQLGRKLTVGEVDFKPWSLELEIKVLVIAQASGQGEQLRIGRAYVNAELQSILRFAPVVDAVEIDGVRGSLVHLGDGRYDIDDILAKLAALPKAQEPPSKEPPKFAIYNIALKDWALEFDDRPAGKKHRLSEFKLSLPFLSTLAAQRDVKTEPHLSFALNGSRFDSTGQSTPFVQTRKTDATLSIKALDVSPYLPYLKGAMKGLPVQPVSAVLGADLKIDFEQNPKPAVRITGQISGQGVGLNDAAGQGVLAVQEIRIQSKDVQPLAGRVALEAIEITAPALSVQRRKDGELNLQSPAVNAPKKGALHADSLPENPPKDTQNVAPTTSAASSSQRWQISVERVSLQGGSITWSDESTQPRAQIAVQSLTLQATQIAWPFTADKPVQFEGSSLVETGSLTFAGTATDIKASVSAQLSALPLAIAGPYVQAALVPALTGSADVQAGLIWQAQRGDQKAALQMTLPKAQLSNLLLVKDKSRLAQIKSISTQTAQIDLLAQTVNVAKIAVVGVQTRVERDAQGRWMAQNWIRAASATSAPAATSTSSPDWKVTLGEIELDAPQLAFIDRLPSPTAKKPVALDIANLKARASSVELQGSALGKKPIPVNLSLNLAQGDAQASSPAKIASNTGLIKLQGQITPAPLAVQLDGALQRIPVHALEPYFGEALNIDLLRLDASYSGKVQVAQAADGLQVKLAGDVVLEELQTTLRSAVLAASSGAVAGDELVNWKALNVKALGWI
ncbi:MAG: DUF748 domain-containing protein [Brachymonas sp.]